MSESHKIEERKSHLRHMMLFFFCKGKNAAQTTKEICAVYGEGILSPRTSCKWFAEFKNGIYDLEDRERTGRPKTVDDKRILQLIEENPSYTTRKIAEILQVSHASVKRHLQSLKYVPSKSMKST